MAASAVLVKFQQNMISLIVDKLSLWNLARMNLINSHNNWTNIGAPEMIFIYWLQNI